MWLGKTWILVSNESSAAALFCRNQVSSQLICKNGEGHEGGVMLPYYVVWWQNEKLMTRMASCKTNIDRDPPSTIHPHQSLWHQGSVLSLNITQAARTIKTRCMSRPVGDRAGSLKTRAPCVGGAAVWPKMCLLLQVIELSLKMQATKAAGKVEVCELWAARVWISVT